jgi:glutamine---fructose-6-phosphate transaminase (isomerizing)
MTTRFPQDIIRQPVEMHRTIGYLTGPGQEAMQQASSLIRSARDVVITGIGASWNAALSAETLFYSGGRPVHMQKAGELLHFTAIPRGAVIIAISRTGRSIEIVQLLAKAEASGAAIIGVTNSADSQ